MGSDGRSMSFGRAVSLDLSQRRQDERIRRISAALVEHEDRQRNVLPMQHSVFALQIATELDNLSTAEARLARDLVFAVRHHTTTSKG
jgi:hypothetical protein